MATRFVYLGIAFNLIALLIPAASALPVDPSTLAADTVGVFFAATETGITSNSGLLITSDALEISWFLTADASDLFIIATDFDFDRSAPESRWRFDSFVGRPEFLRRSVIDGGLSLGE